MSRQVNLGQIVPNIQIGTTTTSNPGTQASVTNVGTALNPILNFSIPKGDAGAIKVLKVNELPTEDIKDDTIYLVPMPVIEVETLPATGQMYTIYVVTSTQKRYRYVSGQWVETLSNDNNLEYMYIDNAWELVGQADIEIDLTDYVKNTDYATASKGGVVKISSAFATQLANGVLIGNVLSNANYESASNNAFVTKGTLDNVLTATIGDIQTLLDNLDSGSGV